MSRRGLTLLEVLLVAVVLVVLTAVAAPAIGSLFGRQTIITATAEAVRFLDENRRRAVDEGVPRWVRLQSGGPQMMGGPEGGPCDHDGRLTEPCTFEDFDPAERLSGVVEENAIREQVDAAWCPPATFRPDGTSTDLTFSVGDESGRRREVILRGLTGRTRLAGVGQ